MNITFKHITKLLILILLVNTGPALADTLPELNFVTDKDGNLLIREDNIYVPESTLKVSISTPIIDNRYRLVAIDYVMVVTDPYDNIVFIETVKDRSRSYTTESNAVFSKNIPETWINGEYRIDIYSYDRIDHDELSHVHFDIYDKDTDIENLAEFFDDPSDSLLERMGILKSRSDADIVKDRLYFIVDDGSNPCKIQNVSVSRNIIPVNSTVQITAEVENTASYEKNVSYPLFLNNKSIKTFNSVVRPREWKTFTYEINDPPVGEHQIRLGEKTVNFTVSDIAPGPTQFVYQDLFTDRTTLYAGEAFNISVTILNLGKKGSEQVSISVDDTIISGDVELDYGEKRTVKYETLINESGTFSANIIGTEISKFLFVKDVPDTISNEDENKKTGTISLISGNDSFYIVVMFLLAIFGILGLIMYRRKRKIQKSSENGSIEIISSQK